MTENDSNTVLKSLVILRHAKDDPETRYLSPDGYASVATHPVTSKLVCRGISHLFHTTYPRTIQTLVALCQGMSETTTPRPVHVVPGLGSENLITRLFPAGLVDLQRTRGLSNYEAFMQFHGPDAITSFMRELGETVHACFEVMSEGDLGLVISHDPIVSLIGRDFGWQDARSIEHLEGIEIKLMSTGELNCNPLLVEQVTA